MCEYCIDVETQDKIRLGPIGQEHRDMLAKVLLEEGIDPNRKSIAQQKAEEEEEKRRLKIRQENEALKLP